ncbi:hypothetical protein AAG906_005452 [Vitis piasezkii]
MVEEKNMQIASLINKVEAQVQNMGESSQGLNHLLNVASPLDDAPHAYRTIQVERQMAESASLCSSVDPHSTLMYSKRYTKRIDNLRCTEEEVSFSDFDVPNMLEDLLQKRLLKNDVMRKSFMRLFSPWDAKLKEKLSHGTLSFMDGSLGYNQIQMGIYCYKVMPFGLNNADAMYQHAMQKIFDDMLHKIVECYVDNLVVKSRKREDHLRDLCMVFDRLRRYQLMNLLKCAFGQCQPFNRLMKKDVPFVWDKACHNAFESIKKYLANPPILGAPMAGKPLILYIAAQKCSLGALSTRYDGTCADVVFVSQKDRYYHVHLFLVRDALTTSLNTKP